MATIDLKLKTYEQLQFEVMNLNTKNYLQQQELERYKNIIDELERWIEKNKQFQVISERCIVWEDKLIDKLKELKGSDN